MLTSALCLEKRPWAAFLGLYSLFGFRSCVKLYSLLCSLCAEGGGCLLGIKYKHCCYSSVVIPSIAVLFLKIYQQFGQVQELPAPVFKLLTCFRACFVCVVMAVIHIQVGRSMDHNVQLVFGMSGSLICYKQ